MSKNIKKYFAEWDWHYRIYFDPEIRKGLDKFVQRLTDNEKKIYEQIMNFFLSFYSISQLLDALEQNPEMEKEIKETAFNTLNNVVYTPISIRESVEVRIDFAVKQGCDWVKEIYKHSCNVSYCPDCLRYYRILFGPWIESIMKIVGKGIMVKEMPHGDTIQQGSIGELAASKIDGLCGRKDLNAKYGLPILEGYKVVSLQGAGYAEWWDSQLLDGQEDNLILYENKDSLFQNDLLYTLLHEVYPGHGQFYRTVAHAGEGVFDHGAMALIEGWATFVEWNAIPSKYTECVRHNACALLNAAFHCYGDELSNIIFDQNKIIGLSEDESLRTVIRLTQYFGFREVYYLGALWFEDYFDKNKINPAEFLKFLSNVNAGDFFTLW